MLIFSLSTASLSAQTVDFSRSKTEGCAPLGGVNFTDQSSGDSVVDRRWNLGNGYISNDNDVVGRNFDAPGTYRITLSVTFENGKKDSISKNVVVHPYPIAQFVTNDTLGCAPLQAHFEDRSTTETGTVTDWEWHFGAGNSTDENADFTFDQAGSYNVSLIVKNNWGCSSEAEIKQDYLKVLALPNVSFTSNIPSACEVPLTVDFTNTTTGSGNITYEWDFGDGSDPSAQKNPSHTYTLKGTYTVRLVATVNGKCSKAKTSKIEVGGQQSVLLEAPDNVCTKNNIAFKGKANPSSGNIQYKWVFSDDGTTKMGKETHHRFQDAGDYEVEFITSSNSGCSDTARKTIHVRQLPQAAFTADQQATCAAPFSVDFTNQTTPATGLTYHWDFGDGATSSELNPTHVYQSRGPFTVKLTATVGSANSNCSNTITKKNLISLKASSIHFSINYEEGCKSLPVETNASVKNLQGVPDTLIWDWGDGNRDTVTSGTLKDTHLYSHTGTFDVQLILITTDGCRLTSSNRTVKVVDKCDDDGSPYNDVGDEITNGGIGNFTVGKISCQNKYSVKLTDTVKNTKVLSWDFGDGTLKNSGNLNPVTHVFPDTKKKYEVTVRRKDLNSGDISTNTKNVIIIDEKADFIPDISDVCRNQTVHFNTLGIDSSKIKDYIWDFGDGTPPKVIHNIAHYKTEQEWLNGDVDHVYDNNGISDARLIIEDKLGCRDTFQYPVSLTVTGPSVGFMADPLKSCDSLQIVTFIDTSKQDGTTPITKWKWDFGDSTSQEFMQANDTLTHTYTNTSFYNHRTVKLTVTDAKGCVISVKRNNIIKGYRPSANFKTKDTLVCGKAQVTLINTSQAKNAAYQWFYGDGTSSTGKTGKYSYAALGSYDVRLKLVDEGGCVDSVTKPDLIRKIRPVAKFELADTAQCAPASVDITNKSKFGKSWMWDFGDGDTSTSKNPVSHFYSKPGYYTIRLEVKSVNGCADTMTKKIHVRGPIAHITTSGNSGCKPFDLHAKVTGTFIETYAWDYGDGTPVYPNKKDSVVTHSYSHAGKYAANLIMQGPGPDPEGCTFTQKLKDSILVDSLKTDFAIKKEYACDSTKVNLIDLSITPAFSSVTDYQWTFDDGTPPSVSAKPEIHAYAPGNYTLSLMTKSKYGCQDIATQSIAVKAYVPPVVDIKGPSNGCIKENLKFTSSITSPDGIKSYAWMVNGKTIGNKDSLTYTFGQAGTYEISLLVTTPKGCSELKKKQIIIHSLPLTRVSTDTAICIGNSVQLAAKGGVQYKWIPTSSLQGENTATPLASPQQTTNYKVKVENKYGCAREDSVLVAVDKKIDLQYDSRPTLCRGSSVPLSVSGNTSQYFWTPSSGLDKTTGSTVVAHPDHSITYTVVAKSENTCPDDTGKIHLEVLDVPTVNLVSDTTIVAGTKTSIPIQTTGNIVQYEWQPSKGLSCVHCESPSFIADHNITYTATVTMDNGCTATDAMNVRVLCNDGAVYVPTAFTPNGDGENDRFYISGYGITIRHFVIYNRWGKKVFEKNNIPAGDASLGWNGRINDKKVTTTTTFVYKAQIECAGGSVFPIQGYVVLIR